MDELMNHGPFLWIFRNLDTEVANWVLQDVHTSTVTNHIALKPDSNYPKSGCAQPSANNVSHKKVKNIKKFSDQAFLDLVIRFFLVP